MKSLTGLYLLLVVLAVLALPFPFLWATALRLRRLTRRLRFWTLLYCWLITAALLHYWVVLLFLVEGM